MQRDFFFDHFLSTAEADRCTFTFYKLAVENNSLSEFLGAEINFFAYGHDSP